MVGDWILCEKNLLDEGDTLILKGKIDVVEIVEIQNERVTLTRCEKTVSVWPGQSFALQMDEITEMFYHFTKPTKNSSDNILKNIK